MTVERLHPSGGWEIYKIHNGALIRRRYFNFTKREAMAEFRAELRRLKEIERLAQCLSQ
jgi:hypothetical protein